MTTPANPFGKHLRRLREAKGLDQKQLAHAAKISASYLSQLETGTRERPGDLVLLRLAQALDTDLASVKYLPGVVGVDSDPYSEFEDLDVLDGVGAAGSFDELGEQGEVYDRRRPPEGYEDEIGPNGRGFLVRGESMAGFDPLPLHDGQIVWIGAERPEARRRARGLVVAIVIESEDSEPKFVVKWYDGERLYSYRAGEGKTVFPVAQILDVASVIVATAPPRRAPRY